MKIEHELEVTLKLRKGTTKDFKANLIKLLESDISPEYTKMLKEIYFLRSDITGVVNWETFRAKYAGIIPYSIMREFYAKGKTNPIESTASVEKRETGEVINLTVKLKDEDTEKEFENDPVPYILKSVGNLDRSKAEQIFNDALKKGGYDAD